MELLTPEEHQAMEMSAQLWNHINKNVVIAGPTRDSDLREIMFHIHGIQRALLGQAAARAYPDQYRLLGGRVAGDGEEMPVAPWIMQPMIHKDGPYPWGSGRTPVEEQSEDRRTDEPLGHSCSCHTRGGGCDVCKRLNCPVTEDRVSHILTLVTNLPICQTPRSAIGFVKAVTGDLDARACEACVAALDELGFQVIEE